MRQLIAGERSDLSTLDRDLVREIRLRLRGRDVVGHLPAGCRMWAAALAEGNHAGRVLATGPAVPSHLAGDEGNPASRAVGEGEERVPGVILRLGAFNTNPATTERISLAMTWLPPAAPGTPPLLLEIRTAAGRVVGLLELPAPTQWARRSTKAATEGAVVLAELYQRSGVWRLRNCSEWLAGGRAELEERWKLPAERLVVPTLGAPPTAAAQASQSQESQSAQEIPLPSPTVPTTSTSPSSSVPSASLSERLAGLWARLCRPDAELSNPAEAATEPLPTPSVTTSTEVRLPERTARAFAALEGQMRVLSEVVQQEQARSNQLMGTDILRVQARLETLHDTFATLQAEALELQRRKDQAARLGLDLPAAVRELEGDIERTYRSLVRAVEEQAQSLLHGTAQGSRERLSRETLFLETLQAQQTNRQQQDGQKGPLEL